MAGRHAAPAPGASKVDAPGRRTPRGRAAGGAHWPLPVRVALWAVLAALVAYLALLGQSYLAIRDGIANASASYEDMLGAVSRADYDAALEAATSMTREMEAVQAQTAREIWGIPARLPVIGADVRMGRTLAAAGLYACEGALLPVCESGAALLDGDGTTAEDFSNFLQALEDAGGVTAECEDLVGSAGDSHFSNLNDARDSLLALLTGVNGMFDMFRDEISLLQAAGDLASGLSG